MDAEDSKEMNEDQQQEQIPAVSVEEPESRTVPRTQIRLTRYDKQQKADQSTFVDLRMPNTDAADHEVAVGKFHSDLSQR